MGRGVTSHSRMCSRNFERGLGPAALCYPRILSPSGNNTRMVCGSAHCACTRSNTPSTRLAHDQPPSPDYWYVVCRCVLLLRMCGGMCEAETVSPCMPLCDRCVERVCARVYARVCVRTYEVLEFAHARNAFQSTTLCPTTASNRRKQTSRSPHRFSTETLSATEPLGEYTRVVMGRRSENGEESTLYTAGSSTATHTRTHMYTRSRAHLHAAI